MKVSPALLFLACAFAAARLVPQNASADIVVWDVDPTNSYIRLTIPDQSIAVTNIGNVTFAMRDATSTSQWTDGGGRRAALDGEIATDYADGTSIIFLGGSNSLYALDATSLRPNPADWNPATTNYTGTSTALATLGGRARGTFILTFDAAFIAFRSVLLDISNAASGPLPITDGTFAPNTTRCGITTALMDVDGLALPLGFGQPIPDVLHAHLDPLVQQNAAGGTVTNQGRLGRKLTYTINLPNLSINVSGTVVTGSAAGQIVAYAVISGLPPTLSARRQGSELVLAWPTNTTGFLLEYATNLPAANWMPSSPLPVVVNGENVVTNAFTNSAVFYRLHLP